MNLTAKNLESWEPLFSALKLNELEVITNAGWVPALAIDTDYPISHYRRRPYIHKIWLDSDDVGTDNHENATPYLEMHPAILEDLRWLLGWCPSTHEQAIGKLKALVNLFTNEN